MQKYDRIKICSMIGANAFKACESEMLNNKRFILWNGITTAINMCLKTTGCLQRIKNDKLWWLC